MTSLAKDTELVTFGVCQYNPRLITLANINTLCAMSQQTSHLGVLVIRPEVEMQSALSLLALIKPDEVQPRQAIRLRADLELLIRGVDHNPTKSRSPPLPQGHRIYRVNNYLFPLQGHPPSLNLPGLQKLALSSEKVLLALARPDVRGGAGHNGTHDEQEPDPLPTRDPADEEGQRARYQADSDGVA